MENKNSFDIQNKHSKIKIQNQNSVVKIDRGDQLKSVVKSKGAPKKDVESPKDLAKDRGDSVPRMVREKHNSKNTKQNELIKNFESKPKDLVADGGASIQKPAKYFLKNFKYNKTINKSLDKSISNNIKQNEPKSFNKSAAVDLATDIGDTAIKQLDNKAIKSKHLEKHDSLSPKYDEVISRKSDKLPTLGLLPAKGDAKKINDKIHKSPKQDDVNNVDKSKNSVCVVKKNIVENEKHVTRLSDMDEKKRIREKYTFKPNANFKNKIFVVQNKIQDSHVGDNNDVPKKTNNVADGKEMWNKTAKSDSTKIDKVSNSTEESRNRPIIRTVVAKTDATKVYKAVSFTKQKRKINAPVNPKIPISMKHININIPNDALVDNMVIRTLPKVLQPNEDNLVGIVKNTKISQNDGDNLIRNLITSQISQNKDKNLLTKNMKKPINSQSMPDSLMKNTKIPKTKKEGDDKHLTKKMKMPIDALHGTSKVQKFFQSLDVKLSKNAKKDSNSVSKTSVKTKLSKKEKRKRLKPKLSRTSLSKESMSPPTEVAKWAPNCIDQHTKPYYEAWLNTTVAAFTEDTKKHKQYNENQNLIKAFKRLMAKRRESSELVHENYLDTRYTGKIKINHR